MRRISEQNAIYSVFSEHTIGTNELLNLLVKSRHSSAILFLNESQTVFFWVVLELCYSVYYQDKSMLLLVF